MKSFRRKTLAEMVRFKGLGLHSGEPVTVVVRPGEDGISFNGVEAVPENITDTERCTRLGTISTVEHLMSAFAGVGVTDAEVVVRGQELPAMDGASLAYTEGILSAGLSELGTCSIERFDAPVFHSEGGARVTVEKGRGVWRYEFECGDRWPWSQHFRLELNPESYCREVAPARTFVFEDELEAVRAAGLGQGLNERTAFVIGTSTYLNAPKFKDEPARHKMLDLIGDLYLSGVPIGLLNVVATRSGHTANVALADKLRRAVTLERS
ncbi:MAG: UDP-3-O-acyl-N-acetylglucosamine deacetylase [Armatimonadetes bacterium]|nr:UDP-3-O-acyl-N-acetylglucosamine deacetylase [Armatimonadota bacterium]